MKLTLILLVILTLPLLSHGEDLGVIGPTYAIAEPHLLRDIERRLRDQEASGELQRRMKEVREAAAKTLEQPVPVPDLSPAARNRTFYIDPSYTLARDLHDGEGRLLFAAGTRTNPLEIVSLSRHLLLFDARDERQLKLAGRLLQHYRGKLKPILVAGSYLQLMRQWRRPVFYDQNGLLTRRFGIRHVPALVSQQGLSLRVDELELAP